MCYLHLCHGSENCFPQTYVRQIWNVTTSCPWHTERLFKPSLHTNINKKTTSRRQLQISWLRSVFCPLLSNSEYTVHSCAMCNMAYYSQTWRQHKTRIAQHIALSSGEVWATATDNMHRRFCKVWIVCFWDKWADRQTDRQTGRQTGNGPIA